jgi:hypothetical protein
MYAGRPNTDTFLVTLSLSKLNKLIFSKKIFGSSPISALSSYVTYSLLLSSAVALRSIASMQEIYDVHFLGGRGGGWVAGC